MATNASTLVKTRTIAGLKVMCQPLDPMTALELAPEAAMVMAPVLGALADFKPSDDLASLGPAVLNVARQLGGGGLRALAPRLLQTTRVVVDGQIIDLSEGEEAIKRAFEGERLGALLGSIIFAGEVTFGRFFAGAGPRAKSTPTTRPSPSEDSSPSTSDPG